MIDINQEVLNRWSSYFAKYGAYSAIEKIYDEFIVKYPDASYDDEQKFIKILADKVVDYYPDGLNENETRN